jgi:hypothetical protein
LNSKAGFKEESSAFTGYWDVHDEIGFCKKQGVQVKESFPNESYESMSIVKKPNLEGKKMTVRLFTLFGVLFFVAGFLVDGPRELTGQELVEIHGGLADHRCETDAGDICDDQFYNNPWTCVPGWPCEYCQFGTKAEDWCVYDTSASCNFFANGKDCGKRYYATCILFGSCQGATEHEDPCEDLDRCTAGS